MNKKRLLFFWLTLLLCVAGARADDLTVNDGTNTNGYVPIYGYYVDALTKSQFIIPSSDLADMANYAITGLTFYTSQASINWGSAQFEVYLKEVENTSFADKTLVDYSSMEKVYSGSLSISDNQMVVTFDGDFLYSGGNLLIGFNQTQKGDYVSSTWLGVSTAGSYTSLGGYNTTINQFEFLPKVTFKYGVASTCAKPKALSVSDVTGETATISWTSEADAFDLMVNGTVIENVTNPYTLNVNLGTTYSVQVRANCGGGDVSDWTSAVSFTTPLCLVEDQCLINYELTDSYGDGWSGNAISVVDAETGSVLATWTIGSGSTASGSLAVCPGREINFVWVSGGTYSYPDECSAVVTDLNGDEIFSFEAGEATSWADSYVIKTHLVDCTIPTCVKPTDLTADEVTATTATLSWTAGSEDQDAWEIVYSTEADFDPDSAEPVAATANPFTLEGLTPETTYYAYVRGACSPADHSKWSNIVSFTTIESCVSPTDVAVSNIQPTSATVSWQGDGDTYQVRYAEMPEDAVYEWLKYDNDTYYTSVGSSTAGTWTWGVVYPADILPAGVLTKISIYETSNNTENFTVNIYNMDDGETPSGTPLYTQVVTPTGDEGWHEVTLTTPVTIDKRKDLWITLTEVGTYVINVCQAPEPNNNWVLNAGEWHHIGDLASSLANYGWMIRGFIDDVDYDALQWTNVTTEGTSYDIEDLNADTQYLVQVRNKCDEESFSKWVSASFTTPTSCDAPIDLAVNDITGTTAELSWTGYQDAYNIKLSKISEFSGDTSSFEQVGSDVTTTGSPNTYTFDLSAYSGKGTLAIRHYKCTDMYMLDIDDIVVKDAGGNTVFSEDFSSGIPSSFANYDADGDGNMWHTTLGEFASSNSYDNTSGPLTPDNWLIIPNVDLGGTLELTAWGQDADWAAEVFGVFVSTVEDVMPAEEVTIANVTDNPYTLEELEAGATYTAQVQGISDECGTTAWSEPITFTTVATLVLLDNDFDQPEGKKNTDILTANLNKSTNVTLSGRTLYKDGSWNTLTLPFSLTPEQFEASPLAGATVQMESGNSTVEGKHVTLIYEDAEVENYGLVAGYPYFLKWDSGENIVNPTFENVTIEESEEPFWYVNSDNTVISIGFFNAYQLLPEDQLQEDEPLIYYLTANNTLAYTAKPRIMGAFRHAYIFRATDTTGLNFTINFDGEETTGIVEIDGAAVNNEAPEGYYNLQGVKLNGKPTQKGVYIHNGKKEIIK